MLKLLLLPLIPFILAACAILAALIVIAIMMPFNIFVMLCLYRFDWRECFDMEFGTNFRKDLTFKRK